MLIAVSPNQRQLEIVTGRYARKRIPDRDAKLAALSMAASFGGGDLAGGLVRASTSSPATPARAEPARTNTSPAPGIGGPGFVVSGARCSHGDHNGRGRHGRSPTPAPGRVLLASGAPGVLGAGLQRADHAVAALGDQAAQRRRVALAAPARRRCAVTVSSLTWYAG